jgi:hypothetical protein
VESNWPPALQAEVDALPRPGFLLERVHFLYRNQSRRWFAIMAPTSVLAAIVLLLSDQQVKAIFRSIPRGETQYHTGEFVEGLALRFGGFFVSWLLGCFALAAIATAVNSLDQHDDSVAWEHDSYQRAREHLGRIVLAAAVTFCAFLASLALAQFVPLAAAKLIGWSHFSRFMFAATFILYIVVASIVSWLGAAIPIILGGEITVWAALKRSVEVSSGYEGALFLLVIESLVGSYLAWYATYHGLRMLVPDHLRHRLWYGWGVYLLAVLVTAAVEPPLFIGFSLLADPDFLKASSLPHSQQPT